MNFAYLHGGCIAGSCALAMYLEKNNMPSYRPYDIDIYIPCKTSGGLGPERILGVNLNFSLDLTIVVFRLSLKERLTWSIV